MKKANNIIINVRIKIDESANFNKFIIFFSYNYIYYQYNLILKRYLIKNQILI